LSVLLTVTALASPVGISTAAGQVTYAGALSTGRAFTIDRDDPNVPGSYSVTGAFERRHRGSAFSLGVEAGLHEYLVIHQDLPPDVTGWSIKLDQTGKAWRATPFVRWGAGGSSVRVYGQVGMGLYVHEHTGLNQQRQGGMLVVDEQYTVTDADADLNLGMGLELFPGSVPVGLTLGFRGHGLLSGEWFNTAEVGVVYRWGDRVRRP
jgi:hypothetical protein